MRILIGGAARYGFVVGLAIAMTGCTAGIATEVGEPIRPAGGAEVEIETLALLPPTTERGSEDAGPVVIAAAEAFLASAFPGLPLVVAEEARDRLGSRGVGAELAQLLRDYDDSGVADLDRIHRVLEALEVDHVLQLRVGLTEGDVLRGGIFAEDVSDERRREVVIVARLWGRGQAAPLWEATARGQTETGAFAVEIPEREEMLESVVVRLLERLPLGPAGEGSPGGR